MPVQPNAGRALLIAAGLTCWIVDGARDEPGDLIGAGKGAGVACGRHRDGDQMLDVIRHVLAAAAMAGATAWASAAFTRAPNSRHSAR